MAMQLPRIVRSPSTLQYHQPNLKPKLFYKRRFVLTDDVKQQTLKQPWLEKTDPLMPPYPYGKNETFLEANNGLYGGSTIQSGNKISAGRNKGKTVRKWYPNVRVEKVRSEALDRELTIPITARVMRTINKCGGLDQYLLGEKPSRIKELGLLGWKLRWHVMNSAAMKGKYAAERRNLGLPETGSMDEEFQDVWNDPEKRQKLLNEQEKGWEELREKDERFRNHAKRVLKWTTKIPKLVTLRDQGPDKYALSDVKEEGSHTRHGVVM